MAPRILLGHPNRYFDGMVVIVNRDEGTVTTYNKMQRWIVSEREKGGPDVSLGFAVGYR